MSDQQETDDLDIEFMRLVMDNPQPSVVRAAARTAKKQLYLKYLDLARKGTVIDSIVNRFAYDPTWPWGLQDPDNPFTPTAAATATTGVATPRRPNRDRILTIASDILTRGDAIVVDSKEIAEMLQREGVTGNIKNLMTSVGNVLTRNGWKRVGPGEYEPATADAGEEEA